MAYVISHRGIEFEAFHIAFNMTGTVTQADIGKAVSIDSAAPGSVKLAADGDLVFGKLVTYEARTIEGVTVATVATKFGHQFVVAANAILAIGTSVVGAGAGLIKTTATANNTVVLASSAGLATVLKQ
jgi:hypothetical protein